VTRPRSGPDRSVIPGADAAGTADAGMDRPSRSARGVRVGGGPAVCRRKMVAADHLKPAAAEMTSDPFAIGPHLGQRGVNQLTAR